MQLDKPQKTNTQSHHVSVTSARKWGGLIHSVQAHNVTETENKKKSLTWPLNSSHEHDGMTRHS